MTNPLMDYERNKAMGLLKDENDPFSIKTEVDIPKTCAPSNQARSEGSIMGSWFGGMKKLSEEQDRREQLRCERLDKIIVELEAVDRLWWSIYPEAHLIAKYNEELMSPTLRATDENYSKFQRKTLMRRCVENYILKALGACIRAGFVQPTEKAND